MSTMFSGFRRLLGSNGRKKNPGKARPVRRLRLEGLEDRSLMATNLAAIAGTVTNGATSAGIGGVAVTLYADTDSSGTFTGADTSVGTTTSSSTAGQVGRYRFSSLSAGTFFVQQAAITGFTAPAVATVVISAGDADGVLGPTIDSFDNTEQIVSATASDPSDFSAVTASEAIGGERELLVTYSSGTGQIGQVVDTADGLLQFGPIGNVQGTGTVTWDGPDASQTLNPTGLSSADFLTNPNNGTEPNIGIILDYDADIASGTLTFTIRSGTGGATTSQITRSIPTTRTEELIPFSEFTGADFTDVGAVVVEMSGGSFVNASIGLIAAVGSTVLTRNLVNTPQIDLAISKTDGVTSVVPGQTLTYTIVVTNNGPADVVGATVADSFPSTLTGITYTSTRTGTASGNTASGSGNIADTVSMSAGSTITYTVNATVSPAAVGSLTNTATVTAPTGASESNTTNNSATDTDTLTPRVDLSITKTDGLTQVTPGQAITFTIVVTNSGPSNVTGATVVDAFPTTLTGVTFTSTRTGTASGNTASGTGNINDTVSMAVGSTITYTVNATVASSATGTVANTATVTAPTGVTDTNTSNNTATDTDTVPPRVDLAVTKTDGVTQAIPGQALTYTIVVTNNGPINVTGATIADSFPSALTGITFTSTRTGTASGNTANGTGNINDTVNMAVGSTITYTVNATVAPSATGTVTNTATVTAPAGVTDTNTSNNTATDTDTVQPRVDLAVTKTDGVTQAVPGQTLTYTIVVTNNGPSNVTGATIADSFPSTLTGITFTSTRTGTASGNTASGSGNINDTVTMASGSTITYTVSATVSAAATDSLTNSVTVTAPSGTTETNTANNTATDTDTLTPRVDLAVTKTDNVTQLVPGQTVRYTIVVTNNGPSNVTGATVADSFPTTLTGITYTSATTGVVSGNTASGSGNINNTVSMAAGSTITYTVDATVAASATGSLTNTVTVTAPTGATETNTANNTATDTDTLTPRVDLAVTKTDGLSQVTAGQSITYTIVVTNNGPSNVTGAVVADTFPATLTGITYTSTKTGTVSGNTASGSGNINDTVSVASGSTIIYTVRATVASGATGSLTNTVTVTAPTGVTESNAVNNTATDTDTISVPNAALAGSVYLDVNNNGVRDANELGIAGVTVRLRRTDIAGQADVTATTAADGSYRFSGLSAGTYRIQETQPTAFDDGRETIGSAGGRNAVDNVFAQIGLAAGQQGVGYNFGEVISKRRLLGSRR